MESSFRAKGDGFTGEKRMVDEGFEDSLSGSRTNGDNGLDLWNSGDGEVVDRGDDWNGEARSYGMDVEVDEVED